MTYEFQKEEIKVTYPNGDESFTPGTTETIFWDALEIPQILKSNILLIMDKTGKPLTAMFRQHKDITTGQFLQLSAQCV
jgi:hypothetical protein